MLTLFIYSALDGAVAKFMLVLFLKKKSEFWRILSKEIQRWHSQWKNGFNKGKKLDDIWKCFIFEQTNFALRKMRLFEWYSNSVLFVKVNIMMQVPSLRLVPSQINWGEQTKLNKVNIIKIMEFIPHHTKVTQKHSLDASCAVCGDAATGHYYYGGLSCFSCRTFFRRCVFKTNLNSCLKSQNCGIKVETRSMCQYCRFQKCLRIGMDPEQVTPLEGKRHKREPGIPR